MVLSADEYDKLEVDSLKRIGKKLLCNADGYRNEVITYIIF